MNGERPRQDIIGVTLAVAFIAGLVGVSLWVISPFAGAMVWAAMIVISTWSGMQWPQARLFGRRWLAVTAKFIPDVDPFIGKSEFTDGKHRLLYAR